jgi:Zn-finger nucleic acid-binding protein
MARISDRARFCHYCATPITVQGSAGDNTDQSCPACGDTQKLQSRSLGTPPVSILECGACGGLWLHNSVFQLLEQRASSAASSGEIRLHQQLRGRPTPGRDPHGRYYRACPVCGTLMHRRNYGRRSGVLIDLCGEHGVWFDMEELDRIIHWVKAGGLGDARKWEQQQQSAQQRLDSMMDNMRKTRQQWDTPVGGSARAGSFLDGILDYLL